MSLKMIVGGVVTGHPWGMVVEFPYEMKCGKERRILIGSWRPAKVILVWNCRGLSALNAIATLIA